MTSASEVADKMRAVAHDRARSSALLAELFADQVVIRHVPPGPRDGPVSGALISEVSLREVEALANALPGAVHQPSDITVEGEFVRVRGHTTGTLADGTEVDVRTNTLFTVADGAIVALQSEMDSTSADAWRTILAAGGLESPAPPAE